MLTFLVLNGQWGSEDRCSNGGGSKIRGAFLGCPSNGDLDILASILGFRF